MEKRIALVGNPNSGKTTLFNNITGLNQTVGNWSGVTIEKKIGKYIKNKNISVIDLPGIYSMTSYTLEEKITRNYILEEKPDILINVLDSTNLERNLYLTTQIIECGVRMVVALNMQDELKRNGINIDIAKLEEALGVKVVSVSALNNKNIDYLMKIAEEEIDKPRIARDIVYDEVIEKALTSIKNDIKLNDKADRFITVKLLEKDAIYQRKLLTTIN